jgi:plasmid maintenance system killer protein
MVDDAATDQDLRVPPSNHFEKLRGNLGDLHSIRVNNGGGLSFVGTAAGAKQQASIWTTIAICEANHVDYEA